MPNNNLTAKEVTLIADLLTYEENAVKKTRLYSKQMTDPVLQEEFNKLSENHQKRFNALLNLL
ncbi:MAG: spore coat protein [Clostridia bacterium]|nr:spore coat protein [Clostridia bacterium]